MKRFSGTMAGWQDKTGWIEPAGPIYHEGVTRGPDEMVYVEVHNVIGVHPEAGSEVTFSVFTDAVGSFGAEKCRVVRKVWSEQEEQEWAAWGGAATYAKRARTEPAAPTLGGEGDDACPLPVEAVELKAGLSAVKNLIMKQTEVVPLLAAFASKAKVTVNPSRVGTDFQGLPKAYRMRITPTRVGGFVTNWDGENGVVQPHEAIWHPEAHRKIWAFRMNKEDMLPPGAEVSEGMEVTFFAYMDGKGCGAESCLEFKGVMLKGKIQKSKASEQAAQAQAEAQALGGAERSEKSERAGRERVTETPVFGEVVEVKAGHVWVEPEETIDHPLATRHEGRIYLNLSDAPEGKPLALGAALNFHVYADINGLGAEDVLAFPTE